MHTSSVYIQFERVIFQSLTMSNEARKTTTVGEIVNLMSVDAQRLQDVSGYLWMLWSSPFQIGIAIYLLYNILGVSVFAGLGTMVLMFPLNAFIANIQSNLQVFLLVNFIARLYFKNVQFCLRCKMLYGRSKIKKV